MPSERVRFADRLARITKGRPRRRNRLAMAIGVPSVLVISVTAAAAAGAFASTAVPQPGGPAQSVPAQTVPAQTVPAQTVPAKTVPAKTTAPARAAHVIRVHTRHTAAAGARPATSCTTVGHIGDSTSVGMVSAQVQPDPAQRLAAQYADVGVRHVWVDASGGRSIVEVMPDQVNGYNVARTWDSEGFRGCFVFALGTNDTANVSVGSNVSRLARIDEMMSAAHGQPVLWVNTHTLLSSGPWSEANMQAWNDDLVQACARYPNMRIFNWAGMDQPGWHLPDGIHYTPAGYAIRAAAIAHALAQAFPRGGHSTSCIVN
jgi:GDSL-like Lipase/Acylhydrolase family